MVSPPGPRRVIARSELADLCMRDPCKPIALGAQSRQGAIKQLRGLGPGLSTVITAAIRDAFRLWTPRRRWLLGRTAGKADAKVIRAAWPSGACRGAVDEHSRLRPIVQYPRGEACRRRPHRGPLPQAVIMHRRVRDPPARRQISDRRACACGRQLTTCFAHCSARHATVRADGTPLIAMRSSRSRSAPDRRSLARAPRGRGRRARVLPSTSMPALRYHRNTSLLTRPRRRRQGHVHRLARCHTAVSSPRRPAGPRPRGREVRRPPVSRGPDGHRRPMLGRCSIRCAAPGWHRPCVPGRAA